MRRVLVAAACVAVVIAVGAAIAARTLLGDEAVRARIVAAVAKQTGRTLTIAGPAHLAPSLWPTLVLNEVSLANPPGFSRPAMATARRVEATVALLPLLSHRVEITRLAVVAPDVLLERDAAGRPNWIFEQGAAPAAPASAPSTPSTRYGWALGAVHVEGARFAGPGVGVEVPSFAYDGRSGAISGTAVARGQSFTLGGTAGPAGAGAFPVALTLRGAGLEATLSGDSASAGLSVVVPQLAALAPLAGRMLPQLLDVRAAATLSATGLSGLQLRFGASPVGALSVGPAEFTAPSPAGPVDGHGTLVYRDRTVAVALHADPWRGGGTPIRLRAETDDTTLEATGTATAAGTATLALVGHAGDLSRADPALPPIRDVQLAATLALSQTSAAVSDLHVASSAGDLSGDVTLGAQPRPSLRGALRSARLDLDPLLAARPAVAAPAAPGPAAAAAPAPSRVLPDTPIPFDALDRVDADLRLDIGEALLRGRSLHGVSAHLVAAGGVASLAPAGLSFGDRRLDGEAHANASAHTLSVKLAGEALPAGPVFAVFGGPAESGGTVAVSADLTTTGGTLRAALATLGGTARMRVEGAQIDNAWLRSLLVAFRLPVDAGGGTMVRCAELDAQAAAGRVMLASLALDTSKLSLSGNGTVDLRDETLDLHLSPRLQLGTALSVPLQIRGTLGAPAVALDRGAIAPGRFGLLLGGGPVAPGCDAQAAPAPAPAPADLLRRLLR